MNGHFLIISRNELVNELTRPFEPYLSGVNMLTSEMSCLRGEWDNH